MENSTRPCTEFDNEVCICTYGEWYFSDCVETGFECIDGLVSGIDYFYRDAISGGYGRDCYENDSDYMRTEDS